MAKELSKIYDPKRVEHRVYQKWERSGFFNPDNLPVGDADRRGKTRPTTRKLPRESASSQRGSAFCIIMPPPNANGALHIGHAVFVTLQDIMTRFQRMRGRKALWLPGADHAGFETQVVFDKKLEKEGRSRFQIPRDELYRDMLAFTLEHKKIMEAQLRKLGASCDWSREKFTLDPEIVKIVTETFAKLYEDGLLYRGERIVNWCVKHQTTLSDLEVKYEERTDPLYYITYGPLTLATVRPETKFGDTAVAAHPSDKRYKQYIGKEIEVETLIGKAKMKVIADEAVDPEFGTGVIKVTPAHDPTDFEIGKRHVLEVRSVIGKDGKLNEKTGPYAGLKVAEARERVAEDMERAGLLVKVDPGYKHNVAVCYKDGTVVEPLVMPQWFVRMTAEPHPHVKSLKLKDKSFGKSLRDLAVEAVKSGKIKIIPKRYEKVFFHWMANIRDWNISRQIAWGIRIPAWYKTQVGTEFEAVHFSSDSFYKKVNINPEELDSELDKIKVRWADGDGVIHFDLGSIQVLKDRGWIDDAWIENNRIRRPIKPGEISVGEKPPESLGWIQDPDVLDTWFSSGQWPYATLLASGRSSSKFKVQNAKLPGMTNDYATFYPTDVMETGYDILFFWVARMIMLGLYRTGKVPFRTVYLHGLVRDKDRQKMSKSKGNVIDPLGVAELYGTDAVRMALTVGNLPGQDIIISEEKIRGYRNFANKLWNIQRFIMMNVTKATKGAKGSKRATPTPKGRGSDRSVGEAAKVAYSAEDKRRLAELKALAKRVTADIEKFRFHHAADALYHYTWHAFADKIIESAKPRLVGPDANDKATAASLLLEIHSTLLKLLHPFMPFITEELWQDLPQEVKSQKSKVKSLLMIEPWPATR